MDLWQRLWAVPFYAIVFMLAVKVAKTKDTSKKEITVEVK